MHLGMWLYKYSYHNSYILFVFYFGTVVSSIHADSIAIVIYVYIYIIILYIYRGGLQVFQNTGG